MKSLFDFIQRLDYRERILYMLIGMAVGSAAVYLTIYFCLVPFPPAIIGHVCYISVNLIMLVFLRKGFRRLVKYTIVLSFFVQLTLACFLWFSNATFYGLLYFLVPIATFSITDMHNPKEAFFALLMTVISVILYYFSLSMQLDIYLFEMSDLAVKWVSSITILVAFGVSTVIFYFYTLNLSRKQRELEYLANTDMLTKTMNRRMLFETGEREVRLADKYNYTFTLIAIDIDYFKSVNDTYGHAVGDAVLAEFSRLVRESIRKEDLFARNGGEEFAIITRKTPFDIGHEIAEKIRSAVERHPFMANGKEIRVTISLGLAQYDAEFRSFGDMMIAADRALYRAKDKGRNRIE